MIIWGNFTNVISGPGKVIDIILKQFLKKCSFYNEQIFLFFIIISSSYVKFLFVRKKIF